MTDGFKALKNVTRLITQHWESDTMSAARTFDAEFFPTPKPLIAKMLSKVSKDAVYYLEPSAGRGDIALAIRQRDEYSRYGSNHVTVNCIEADPDLSAISDHERFPGPRLGLADVRRCQLLRRDRDESAIFRRRGPTLAGLGFSLLWRDCLSPER